MTCDGLGYTPHTPGLPALVGTRAWRVPGRLPEGSGQTFTPRQASVWSTDTAQHDSPLLRSVHARISLAMIFSLKHGNISQSLNWDLFFSEENKYYSLRGLVKT